MRNYSNKKSIAVEVQIIVIIVILMSLVLGANNDLLKVFKWIFRYLL